LSASPSGFYDADGDSATYTYEWYINSSLDSTTSSSLSSSLFDKGDQIYVIITPSDGIDTGTSQRSSTVRVSNSPPTALADATNTTVEECDTVELDASGSTDDDGDALTYSWTISSEPGASHKKSSDIADQTDEMPTFVVDAAGTFTFSLAASDGSVTGTDTLAITVDERSGNIEPIADAGDDQSDSETAACTSSGGSSSCSSCPSVSFALDAGGSYDDDGDPLTYVWSYASSSFFSIDSSTAQSPTVTISGVTPKYGSTTSVSITFTLSAYDCAGGRDTDTVTIAYECTGV
jgi:hypothetical protein